MTVQPVVGAEREVFYRERAAAMYATGPFALVSTKSHRGPLLQLTSLAQPCGSSAGCGERRCTRGAASQPRGVPMLGPAVQYLCFAPPPQATSVVEVPYLAAQSLLMTLLVYWTVGFGSAAWQVQWAGEAF